MSLWATAYSKWDLGPNRARGRLEPEIGKRKEQGQVDRSEEAEITPWVRSSTGGRIVRNLHTEHLSQGKGGGVWLRAVTAFPEDPSSAPNNHIVAHSCL